MLNMRENRNLIISVIIIYAAVQMIMTVALIVFGIDARESRKISFAQREDLKQQNIVIEKQNKYKICMLESLWRTAPEQRTEAGLQKCKHDNL